MPGVFAEVLLPCDTRQYCSRLSVHGLWQESIIHHNWLTVSCQSWCIIKATGAMVSLTGTTEVTKLILTKVTRNPFSHEFWFIQLVNKSSKQVLFCWRLHHLTPFSLSFEGNMAPVIDILDHQINNLMSFRFSTWIHQVKSREICRFGGDVQSTWEFLGEVAESQGPKVSSVRAKLVFFWWVKSRTDLHLEWIISDEELAFYWNTHKKYSVYPVHIYFIYIYITYAYFCKLFLAVWLLFPLNCSYCNSVWQAFEPAVSFWVSFEHFFLCDCCFVGIAVKYRLAWILFLSSGCWSSRQRLSSLLFGLL